MDDYHTKCELLEPVLDVAHAGPHRVRILTDERLFSVSGLRIAFTAREGGVSKGAFSSLNLATHVNDTACDVQENRRRIAQVMGCTPAQLCACNQIHSARTLCITAREMELSAQFAQIDEAFRAVFLHNMNIHTAKCQGECTDTRTGTSHVSSDASSDAPFLPCNITCAFDAFTSADNAQSVAARGFDAIVVDHANACPLLCFADCLPLIIVSPTGRFAVVHAGWRGAYCQIASRAACALACLDALDCVQPAAKQQSAAKQQPSHASQALQARDTPHTPSFNAHAFSQVMKQFLASYNMYIGPHISHDAFEVGADVFSHFIAKFGSACSHTTRHVSLSRVVQQDLCGVGCSAQRIANAHQCTVAQHDVYFSYRHANGVCGRIGALAYQTRGVFNM